MFFPLEIVDAQALPLDQNSATSEIAFAVDTETHPVRSLEQEEDSKPVARMILCHLWAPPGGSVK
jgi:hypothetical protein